MGLAILAILRVAILGFQHVAILDLGLDFLAFLAILDFQHVAILDLGLDFLAFLDFQHVAILDLGFLAFLDLGWVVLDRVDRVLDHRVVLA